MADISFWRGEKSKVGNVPLKDGQFIVCKKSDDTAAIYADMKMNGKLVRVVLDITSLIERLADLEDKILILEESVERGSLIFSLVSSQGENIVTNENETILAL